MQPDRVVAARLLIPEPTERSKLLREKSLRGLNRQETCGSGRCEACGEPYGLSQEEACPR